MAGAAARERRVRICGPSIRVLVWVLTAGVSPGLQCRHGPAPQGLEAADLSQGGAHLPNALNTM
eukprot:scaffold1883_cov396-Prasinococcus_capsulatus_cf.AAC.29